MKRRALLAAATLACGTLFVSGRAQTRPLVTGTWKMDASRSRFLGPRGAPKNVIMRLEAQGSSLREILTVTNSDGESTKVINYSLDGKQIINGSGDEQITSRAAWDGDTLVLQWTDDGGTLSRKLSFSADRRMLTVKVHDTSADGETEDLIVLEKQ